ncbi:MAG: type II secretion system protein [Gemmatimonadales bacterium]
MKKRRGFTLVELMTVVIVMTLLAGIAVLKYVDLRNNAVAAQVANEFRAIAVATLNYHADSETWPPETGAGGVPVGLGPLLPGQLAGSFDRDKYLLDYENFGGTNPDVLIGVAVTTPDPRLFAKFVQYLGTKSPFFLTGSSKLTYLIAGPGGVF